MDRRAPELLQGRRHAYVPGPRDAATGPAAITDAWAAPQRELSRSRRLGRPLVVVVCESRESAGGRLAGRRRLDARLRSCLRAVDVVLADGRQTCVVAPETGADEMRVLLDRLRAVCGDGAGFGAAMFPDDAVTWQGLVVVARQRLALSRGDSSTGSSSPVVALEASPADGAQPAGAPRQATCRASELIAGCSWLPLPHGGRPPGWQAVRRFQRRVADLLLVTLLLPFALPAVVVCAALIKGAHPSAPVLFVQQRSGLDGRSFRMFKLRTMVPGAEALKPLLAAQNELSWPDFKISKDPRVTRLGRVMRASSLDELPQLYNVLRGDMSIVGPRPTFFAPRDYRLWQTERLDVKPGLTGVWQLLARSSVHFDDRARLDIAYVRRESLMLDVRILLRTVPAVLRRCGAR